MRNFLLFVCASVLIYLPIHAQENGSNATKEVLRKGFIVSSNVDKAVQEHLVLDRSFKQTKQLPDIKYDLPPMLAYKNGDWDFDWTPGQQARYLMEQLRQGIHALQSVDKPTGFDIIALTGGREYWPKLREISCRENPGIKYYDLDGFEQYCPTK